MPSANKNRGFIELIAVLIGGAAASTAAIILMTIAINSSLNAGIIKQTSQSRLLADACAEEGLIQLSNNNSYTGTGNLSMGSGTCSYTVTKNSPTSWTINASGMDGSLVRRDQILINQVFPKIHITSWSEVADF